MYCVSRCGWSLVLLSPKPSQPFEAICMIYSVCCVFLVLKNRCFDQNSECFTKFVQHVFVNTGLPWVCICALFSCQVQMFCMLGCRAKHQQGINEVLKHQGGLQDGGTGRGLGWLFAWSKIPPSKQSVLSMYTMILTLTVAELQSAHLQ